MRSPDIVFIKPGSQKELYGRLSEFSLTAVEPPLWAALLAGFLREKGYSVRILDAEAENLGWGEAALQAADMSPLLACVTVSGTNPSASTMNMEGAGEIVRRIKVVAPRVKTMLWGLHPSALPQRTLDEEKPDFVCQGEGFFTLGPLLDSLKNGASAPSIPGLWAPGHKPPLFPPVWKDLGTLPQPAWELLPMEKYRAHNWHCFDHIHQRQPYGVLYTSLGCPFSCSFCCVNALFNKRTLRCRPLDQVLSDLDILVKKWGVRNIKIMDEMFGLDEKRVVELCRRIAARKYDLNMWAYARVSTVTEPMLEAMKAAGINWVAYGFESASNKVLDDVGKGYGPERVNQVVQMTRRQGIHICANYVFGLPEDDLASMEKTLDFMMEINASWANIYCAMAYPGSGLYSRALEQGWDLPDSWRGYSQYAPESLPLPAKELSGGQVLAFRDKAFNTYYKNPAYLTRIQENFGVRVLEHVQKMTEKTLARENAAPLEPGRNNEG